MRRRTAGSGRGPQETAAHQYADAGWLVFPCRAGSKEPATEHGFRDATTDHRQIGQWWSRDPDQNVAVATGAPGPDVVDVDNHGERGNGYGALNRLKRAGLADGYQAVVQTPSRGLHLYYAGTEQRNGSIRGQHLDFRSTGGYVVCPPSQTAAGRYVVAQHGEPTGRRCPGMPSGTRWSRRHSAFRRPSRASATPGRRALTGSSSGPQHGRQTTAISRCSGRPAGRTHRRCDGPAVERFVDAARRNGMRGGEREARRTIVSAAREAAAMHPFAPAPQRQLQAGA